MGKKYFVYIIEAENKKFYTGITTDISRRLKEHSQTNKAAKFFRMTAPKRLLYIEECSNRSQATKREIAIKKMKRGEKEQLVATFKGQKSYPI